MPESSRIREAIVHYGLTVADLGLGSAKSKAPKGAAATATPKPKAKPAGKKAARTIKFEAPEAASVEPPPPAGARLAGLRLLAAEDAEVNRILLESQLQHEGAEVVFAEDGAQAVAAIERAGADAFDAVLMDVQMPVMDGLEATRRLRALAPRLPVIGLTAHALEEEHRRCMDAGMAECVVKPADLDLLVASLLRRARARALARRARARTPELDSAPA